MAAPTVSIALDKPSYVPGSPMVATVTYGDPDTKKGSVSVVVTDSGGNASAPVVAPYVIDPVTVTLTDPSRTWTKVSDNGSIAVFTATA